MSAPLQRRADVDTEPNYIGNALPIFIVLNGKPHHAILRNLSTSCAVIITSASLVLDMEIEFHCGAMCALGSVVWQRRSGSCIKFNEPICELQLAKDVSRSNAVASPRNDRLLLNVV